MNTLNNWCRAASLIGCLVLAIEGNLFVHNLASQARALEGSPAVVGPQPAMGVQEIDRNHPLRLRWIM